MDHTEKVLKSSIEILEADITDMDTDCIVNAANTSLMAGSGVCGAIFSAAGYTDLTNACDKIGHCDTGDAVITPGFRLHAKYIIHTPGPVWEGGNHHERQLLYNCYINSLKLAMVNKRHSIAFPLISAGIFGYPKREAWEVALGACQDFIREHEDYPIKIVFAVLDSHIAEIGKSVMEQEKQ